MKHFILFVILLTCLITAAAQSGSIRLLPEAGLSYPLGDFKSQNVFAAKGYQFGGHLDLMWGSLGLGLYGGMDRNDIQYEDLLPASNPGLSIVKTADIDQGYWRQLAAGLGPVLRLNFSKRLNFELSSKIGVAQFSYPAYSQLVNTGTPPGEEFTLFQTNNEAAAKRFNPMLLSAGRLNIGFARNIDLSLSGNFRHVRDVRHAYRYLDGDFSPGMSNEALIEALRTAPTVAEVRKCHFNSVGVTVGLGITFGGKKEETQYYELRPRDEGDYVEGGSQLRVKLPKNIYVDGKVAGRIFNAKNEEVLKVENLLPGNRSAFHSTDEQGRVALSLRGLPEGYYRLEVQDEQHRRYFLRFKIGKTAGNGKD